MPYTWQYRGKPTFSTSRCETGAKVYIRDSGLLHYLLNIEDMRLLQSNPRYGASWEGFALEQILSIFGDRNAYYWKTQHGAGIDLLVFHRNLRIGFEFKCSDAPRMTKSMRVAMKDLMLDKLIVVYPGSKSYLVEENIHIVPLKDAHTFCKMEFFKIQSIERKT